MASNSSKAIPYLVLAIIACTIIAEGSLEIDIDLEVYIPVLAAMGVSGAALSAVKSAATARKLIPKDIQDLIRTEALKLKDVVKKPTEQ